MSEQLIADGFQTISDQLQPIAKSIFVQAGALGYMPVCSIEDGIDPYSAYSDFVTNWSIELTAVAARIRAVSQGASVLANQLMCVDFEAAADLKS